MFSNIINDATSKDDIKKKLNQLLKFAIFSPSENLIKGYGAFISAYSFTQNILVLHATNQYGTYTNEITINEVFDQGLLVFLVNAYVIYNNTTNSLLVHDVVLDKYGFQKGNAINIHEYSDIKKYKYMYYRQKDCFDPMKERMNVIGQIRKYFFDNNFIELETPILAPIFNEYTDSSFLTEDTLLGGYYSLPQSPQVFKQLAIMSGVQRYFQIARCFRRDADGAYKKIEFTQMDVEVATGDSKAIMAILENLIINLFKEKNILINGSIPIIEYDEAIKQYGTDKPILPGNPYSLIRVIKAPIFEKDSKTGKIIPTHHLVSKPVNEDIHLLDSDNEDMILSIRGDNYDLILNGQEVAGGDIRINDPVTQLKTLKILGYTPEYIKNNYGRFIEALENGCPPHGGFATGVERILTLLNNHNNIEKYILFPKYADGDPMTQHPRKIFI